jgi:hypothetical protein
MRRNDEPHVTASKADNDHSAAPNRETASCSLGIFATLPI